jgi:SSS family solute:Na+ symporter
MKNPIPASLAALCAATILLQGSACCGTAAEPKRPTLLSYFGHAPTLDGQLAPGEWADATELRGVRDWVPEFSPVTDDADLALRGWVKHDDAWLYFAFDITDDVLYGLDTERWLPTENPKAHELTREGFPWFGDEMEILLNAPNTWRGDEGAEGDGASWQMVCNLTKSRLGGIGVGGLLEGEPRSEAKAWETYQRWIKTGAQKAVAKKKPAGKGYVIEWAIRFDPCVEIAPGQFYSPALGEVKVGLNIALGDLDTPAKGAGNFGNFHHEQWWAGAPHTRTQKNNFGTLQLMGRQRNSPRTRP